MVFGKKKSSSTEMSPSFMEGRDSVTLRDEQRVTDKPVIGKGDLERNLKEKRKEAEALNGNAVVSEAEVSEGQVQDSGDINYRCLHWWQVGLLMIAETISLGILSLPSVFATVGMPGGIILILGLGLLATYTGYNIGLFALAYPFVRNQADAGEVLGGPVWREILGFAQIIFLIFICGSHVLTGLIALETIASDGVCTVVWAVIIAAVSCLLTMPRTFTKLSYFSVASFLSIFSAVMITMIGLGINGKSGMITAKAAPGTNFRQGFTAATNVIFAYAGHAAFFNFIAEMKKPSDYDKALYLLQGMDITLYLVAGIVIYYYVGDTASSPALGNLPKTLSRIAYGVAIPTIVIAGVINGSVAAKLAMQRVFHAESKHYKDSTKLGWIVWISIVVAIWAIAFVIANVIPFFNQLLGVISALFASIFTYGISGVFWLHLNPRRTWFQNKKMAAMACLNIFIVVAAAVIMGAGLYASIRGIIDGYQSGEFGSPFSCASRS